MSTTCPMVINWKCDANGEPGEEIICGKPGEIQSEDGLACVECALAIAREGLLPDVGMAQLKVLREAEAQS